MGQISNKKSSIPKISYVFLHLCLKQNFPQNDKISWEWGSSILHFFQACAQDRMIDF